MLSVLLTAKSCRQSVSQTAAVVFLCSAILVSATQAQSLRKVIIDQDTCGPGGSNMQAILALINSPQTEVLGITVPTGGGWRDEEVLHALRLLEIIGRTDIPVVPGAAYPLVSSREFIVKWEKRYGKVEYQGAWSYWKGHPFHGPTKIPAMPEGEPSIQATREEVAHFLARMVRQYPHEITIYAAGPMTDLALAIAQEPQFAELAKELVVMGGSMHPGSMAPEFAARPKREFNFWMDPEAAHVVLHAHWARVVLTTADISVKTRMEKGLIAQLAKSTAPGAQYAAKYAEAGYLWDELAAVAWLDGSLITKSEKLYVDVNVNHGAGYGDTLAWSPGEQPGRGERLVEVQQELDKEKFYREFVDLLTRGAPHAFSVGAVQ